MGGGSWTKKDLDAYASTRGLSMKMDGKLDLDSKSTQDIYTMSDLHPSLKITGRTIRECRDTEEHPETVPVILALDVTGSMGPAAREVASALNKIMTDLYGSVKDVEFMIMAIGDFSYDRAPVQVSQFESDIRIAEALDKVWFEGGGGSNAYESYTAAWWIGLHNTDLDCWKRHRKGLIITIGDEPCNPYLPEYEMEKFLGIDLQGDVETKELLEKVRGKYDVSHINVVHGHHSQDGDGQIRRSFGIYGVDYHSSTVNGISDVIVELVKRHAGATPEPVPDFFGNGETEPKAEPETVVGDITW